MIIFANCQYPNRVTLAREGRKAAAGVIRSRGMPMEAATELVKELLQLIEDPYAPRSEVEQLLQLVTIILHDGLDAADRRHGAESR